MEPNIVDFIRGEMLTWFLALVVTYFFIQWLWRPRK
jgi:hypothetical protein